MLGEIAYTKYSTLYYLPGNLQVLITYHVIVFMPLTNPRSSRAVHILPYCPLTGPILRDIAWHLTFELDHVRKCIVLPSPQSITHTLSPKSFIQMLVIAHGAASSRTCVRNHCLQDKRLPRQGRNGTKHLGQQCKETTEIYR